MNLQCVTYNLSSSHDERREARRELSVGSAVPADARGDAYHEVWTMSKKSDGYTGGGPSGIPPGGLTMTTGY